MSYQPIQSMNRAAVDQKPVNYDFSEGYPDDWDFYAASRCQLCDRIVNTNQEDGRHGDIDRESRCDGYVSSGGPAMNYFYPLPIFEWQLRQKGWDVDDAARRLVDLPLVIVEFSEPAEEDHEWALALSGGGMDLSNEIIEAYMRLGYLPPAHFTPALFYGQRLDGKLRWLLAGAEAAQAHMRDRYTAKKAEIRQLRRGLRRSSLKQAA